GPPGGRPIRSRLGAATAHELVVELALDQRLHGLRGELLPAGGELVLGELVQVAGELGRHQNAEVLVAGLPGHFRRRGDAHRALRCWASESWYRTDPSHPARHEEPTLPAASRLHSTAIRSAYAITSRRSRSMKAGS